uniref:Adenylate/guanylate cyclase domain-containing protein n=1 Tax=candidate division WOR-3 bacterium TaxID=2052148 RepID=A0A7C4TBK3_UNCW3
MKKFQKDEIVYSVASFLPRKIVLSKFSEGKYLTSDSFVSTLLFADISGFTAMSEKLARMGKEGAEEVNKIINNFFGPLINIVYQYQGDIYRFGGDAFLAFFPQEAAFSSDERAINSAVEILKFVKAHTRTKTKVGTFQIKIHIGLTKGKVYFQDLGNNFFLSGSSANYLMSMIDLAQPGEIIVSPEVKDGLPDVIFEPKGEVWKYIGMKKKTQLKVKEKELPWEVIKEKPSVLEEYIPGWLLKRIELKPYFDHKDGEHRKIAVVFLHFAGIPYDKNPKKAFSMLENFYRIVVETIEKYDGWINAIDVYKDSERVLAIFGFPHAYEDDEKRAVMFTYEILNNPQLKSLKLRAGINSGSVFAAPVGSELRREYTTLGDAVNLSARLAAKAEDRTIVVSEPVFNKTYGIFEYEFLGEKEYKGKKKKIQTYKLIKKKEIEKKALGRWLSESEKIVGRDKEIARLQEVAKLCATGKGQILGITGEPGIGKSRLVQEFIKISKENGYQIYEGNCLSYGSAFSYHPWAQILTTFFNILPGDSVKVRASKIKEKCSIVDKKLLEWLPVIGEVMGVPFPENTLTKYLDAKIRKQRVFDIIFDFMKFITLTKPVNIIIEDLHWADTASMELVNYIGRNIEDKPILLTLVYRPLKRKEEFMEKDWTTELRLRELSKEDSLELVKNLLNIKDIPDDLKKVIITKSQGNPFYIEELIKSLIEQGYIVEEKGTWRFKGDIKKLELPDSVEAVILSRIDRLDLKERDVLQVASVLGREFDGFLINGIYPQPQYLKKALGNLERFDLIKQEKAEGQIRYFFKHILTQEVAYGTLSFARKQELHREIGTFIETELKDRKEEFLGLLSYHFYAGGDYDKSLLYSVEAGEKAKKVYANEEAIEFFTRAIDSYERLEGKIQKS